MRVTLTTLYLFAIAQFCMSYDSIPKQLVKHQLFSTENGLPNTTLSRIGVMPNGLILLKAPTLYLFDGTNFIEFKHPMIPSAGELFFQTSDHHSIYFYDHSDTIIAFNHNDQPTVHTFPEVIAAPFRVLKYTDNEILIYENQSTIYLQKPATGEIKKLIENIDLIHVANDFSVQSGHLHLRSRKASGELLLHINDQYALDSLTIPGNCLSVHQLDDNSGLLFYGHGIFSYDFKSHECSRLLDYPLIDQPITHVHSIFQDGNLLVSINERLFELDVINKIWNHEFIFDNQNEIKSDFIIYLFQDFFKNIYAQFQHSGLLRIQKANSNLIQIFDPNQSDNFTKLVLFNESNQLIYQFTRYSGVRIFNFDSHIQQTITQWPFSKNRISPVYAEVLEHGQVFLFGENGFNSNQYQSAVLDLNQNEVTTSIATPNPLPDERRGFYYAGQLENSKEFYSIYADEYHLKFRRDNLELIEQNALTKQISVAVAKVNEEYWQLAENKITVHSLDYDVIEEIPISDFGLVRCHVELNDSVIVFGGDHGIVEVNTISKTSLKWDNIRQCIFAMAKHEQSIWCSTNNGIIEILDKKIRTHLTSDIGVLGQEFNTNSCAQSKEGFLFFGGTEGITAFHPQYLQRPRPSIQSVIPYLLIDQNQYAYLSDQDQVISLKPSERVISFRISTVGHLPSGNYLSQYAIPGQTNGWVSAGKNGIINLSLPPGQHQVFYSSNTFFDPNAQMENSFTVIAGAYWFQTKLFYFLIGLLTLLLVFYVITLEYQSRLKARTRQLKELSAIQKERDRISRDLHDNIGVQISIVGRSLDWLIDNMDQFTPKDIKQNLEQLNAISAEMNQNLRNTIWASKKPMYSITDVSNRIANFLHQLRSNVTYISFHFTPGNNNQQLHPMHALNLFRIIQEGVHNAVKHAEASEIWVHFKDESNSSIIEIKDNGIGYDLHKVQKGNGLDNMTRRAEAAKLDIHFESAEEIGSRIIIRI